MVKTVRNASNFYKDTYKIISLKYLSDNLRQKIIQLFHYLYQNISTLGNQQCFHKITKLMFRFLTLDSVCQFRNVIFAAALLYLGFMKVTKF